MPVPTTALELDALLRHLEIDAEFADWSTAATHLSQARAVWERLEGPLATRLRTRGALPEGRRAGIQEVARGAAEAP